LAVKVGGGQAHQCAIGQSPQVHWPSGANPPSLSDIQNQARAEGARATGQKPIIGRAFLVGEVLVAMIRRAGAHTRQAGAGLQLLDFHLFW